MSTEEPLYQMGICSHCPTETRQRFLFATDECSGPVLEGGKITDYAQVKTLSLFRCEGCRTILFYSTWPEGELCGYSVDDIELFGPAWVVDEPEFLKHSNLLYASTLLYPAKSILAPSTPEPVRKCYEIGIMIRHVSNDLYALQLRKALEAVCRSLGASERHASGRRAMLWQQIDELRDKNAVGSRIAEAAHELKDISNVGAHYSELGVAEEDIRKLEKLLGLITEYAYHPRKTTGA